MFPCVVFVFVCKIVCLCFRASLNVTERADMLMYALVYHT